MISPKQINSNQWSSQAAWFIDPVSGNDRNAGDTQGTALRTWAEFVSRVRVVSVSMVVTIMSNIAEPLVGEFVATGTGILLEINGTPTILATATGTTFTDPVRSGVQAMGTMTAGNIADFTPYLGKMLRSSDGRYAPIIGVSGVAPQLPYWADENFSLNKPANGVEVDILGLTTTPSVQVSVVGMTVTVRYIRTTDTSYSNGPWIRSSSLPGAAWVACDFAGYLATLSDVVLFGCLFSGTSGGPSSSAYTTLMGGGAQCSFYIVGSSPIVVSGFIINGGGTVANGLTVGNGSNFAAPSPFASAGGAYGLGVFNCTGDAVVLGQGATCSFQSLFGAGNGGYGLNINYGARAWCATTPTITGTSGDLRFCGAATAIVPPVAGVLPAAASLTSWAEWVANFNKQVMNYGNGTSLAGA